jgi:predicted N-formylglutamate amidohydrolase
MALIVSCEHASRTVPVGIDLGLDAAALSSHLAWDEGALALARALTTPLLLPVIAGGCSRLIVDLNRPETSAALIPERTFGVEVPGNHALPPGERERRLARWHRPHWRSIDAALRAALTHGRRALHLSVHSFDPALDPRARDFALGVLFDPDRTAERAWAARLAAAAEAAGFTARDNQPYAGVDEGLTTSQRRRWPNPAYAGLELELSQALDGAARARLGAVLVPVLAALALD